MKKLLLSLVLLGCAAWAQDSARLVGTVTDPTGAVIPKATISVVNEKTGVKREVSADDKGYYFITNLSASVYSVAGNSTNLGPTEVKDVNLAVGQERTLNLILQPASVATEVTVSGGELTQVDTSSAAVGANVNSREVGTLPLNGRQLSQLYLLTPGAQTAGGGSFDNIRFSGRANQQNAVRFDGVEGSSVVDASPGNLNGESSTGFRLQSSLETVAEFRVDSSNYPAEYGTGTGGQISVVTKSGGNAFHGGIFEYLRNDALDARNFFDLFDKNSKSHLRLNQFGGSIGGPIKKDRLFFFLAQENLIQRAGTVLRGTVPSGAARASAVASIAPLLAGYPRGEAVAGNPLLELATLDGSNAQNEYFGSARLDYHANDKLNVYVRYNRDQGYLQSPLDVSGSYQNVTATPQNAVIGIQQILTPTIINETKFGFNGAKTRVAGFAPAIPGVDTSAFSVSFTGNVALAGIGGQGASAGASSLGNLIRSNSTQNGRGQPYTSYTMSFIDNLSIVKQNHAMKFGFEFRPVRIYTDRLGGTTYTYSNINNLLNNVPSQIQVLGDTSAPDPFNGGATGNRFVKQHYIVGYAQDEWKVRPNFTVSYGVRYEYYRPLHEDRNLFVLFNANTGQLMPQDTEWYQSSKKNFGPRLGMTWAPDLFKNKTVLRIGAGYYYGPGQTEDQIQPIDSDRASTSLTGSGIAFPIVPSQVLANFTRTNHPGYQPRAYPPDEYKLPEKILSYTASIQQQLPSNTVLTVAYVGSQGRNLFLRSWTNRMVGVNPTTGAAILQYDSTQFAQIDYKTSGGTDHYDSLQTTVNRRFAKGLTTGFQWTWGRSIGNTGGSNEAQTTQNPMDFNFDHGNNAFDVRHSMNASVLYALPVKSGNKVVNALAGGWEIGGMMNARTGLPIDLTMARNDVAWFEPSNGQYFSSKPSTGSPIAVINNPYGGAFRSNRRPSVVAGVDPYLHGADARSFLNPAAFYLPKPGEFGNLGRFALHGPGLVQFDFTLHKQFAITERQNIEFRAEVYNLLNRANFSNPAARLSDAMGTAANNLQPGQAYASTTTGNGAFGIIQSTVSKDVGLGAQRQIQFSLRYNF
ncbi:MAG: carboxypeptidase regulatory-like domain-containing protein [Bryobacteraceae bacterium]